MTVSPIFKNIVSGGQVEEWTRDTLRMWFPTYLREVERQNSLGTRALPDPRSYTVSANNDKEPEDQLPAVVIVSPGIESEPVADGDGYYRVAWTVGIGIYASAQDHDSTRDLIRYYSAAARAIMLHKQSLGGNANGTVWISEAYDVMNFDDGRTIGAALMEFHVTVAQAQSRSGGPSVPDENPGDGPVVEEVIIDETLVPLDTTGDYDPIEQDDILTPVTNPADPDYPYIVH